MSGVSDFLNLSGKSTSPSNLQSDSSSTTATATATATATVNNQQLELGELEQLTITNDNESSSVYGEPATASKEAASAAAAASSFRKTWNAKYTLRSHFDGVRALSFHPTEPCLITASEDQTLKLWNLQKTIPAKKSASLDVEPVYTFRGHRGPVLCLDVAPNGEHLFSGGVDSTVKVWNMPPVNSVDPYDAFDPSVLAATFTGHSDAVWGLTYHGSRQQLLSCSADGTIKLWSLSAMKTNPLLKTFGGSSGVPTSVDWVYEESGARMVAAYGNGECILFDIESGKQVIKLDTASNSNAVSFSNASVAMHHCA